MTNKRLLGVMVLGGAILFGAASCGDDDGFECGPGTTETDGVCLPDDDGLTCAAGTMEQDGTCVPDGSVICEQGTVFDPDSGACVVDEGACAAGTVLVGGECVPFDDTLVGDLTESAEPNDFTNPDSFTPPAIGDTLTIDGCVTPADFDGDGLLDIDFDVWTFDTTEAALYNITIDGIGGLSGGFLVGGGTQALAADGWQRFGLDLVSDGAQRQVFTPEAGTFFLAVSDSRSLFLNTPAGDNGTCYFLQIERIAIPAATPITSAVEFGTFAGDLGDPQFLSVTATSDQQLLFDSLASGSAGAQGALVHLVENGYRNSGAAPDGAVTLPLADLSDADVVTIVVDHVFNFSLNPVGYNLTVTDTEAQPAGNATLTHVDRDAMWMYFTAATAGEVMRFDFDGNTDFDGFAVDVFDTRLNSMGQLCTDCSSDDEWYRLGEAGTYYVSLYNNDGVDGVDYDVGLTLTNIVPTPIPFDTATSGDLITANRDAFTLDMSGSDWATVTLTNGVDISTGSFDFYDGNAVGRLDGAIQLLDQDQSDVDVGFTRISAGDDRNYLVLMNDYNVFNGSETFDVLVEDGTYTDLAAVTEATPIASNGTVANDETEYFLVSAAPGTAVTVTVTGTSGFDPLIRVLDRDQTSASTEDVTAADEAETFNVATTAQGWVAFGVEGSDIAIGGTFDIAVTAVDPGFGTVVTPVLNYFSVCPSDGGPGIELALIPTGGFAPDDEGRTAPVSLPFAFDHFGRAVTELTATTNGWVTFTEDFQGTADFSPQPLPSTSNSADDVVAPYWNDMDDVVICGFATATQLFIQWKARSFGTSLAQDFQLVLGDDGSYTFVYGPDSSGHGLDSSIGLENADGTAGFFYGGDRYFYPGPGLVVSPGTAVSVGAVP